jgi:hypothetical protein
MPDPQLQAAARRGLTPIKKGFLGRGSATDNADSERSILSHGTPSHVSLTTSQTGSYSPRAHEANSKEAFERRKVRRNRHVCTRSPAPAPLVCLAALGRRAGRPSTPLLS